MRRDLLPLLLLRDSRKRGCRSAPAVAALSKPDRAAPAARGAFPRWTSRPSPLSARPIPQTSEFVATVRSLRSTNIQPQVGGLHPPDHGEGGRPRPRGPAARADRSGEAAGDRVGTRSRSARSREADLGYATASSSPAAKKLFDAGAVSQRELEQAETGGEDGRGAARGGRLADSREPGGAAVLPRHGSR